METKPAEAGVNGTLDADLGLARNAVGEPLKESTKADIRSLVALPDAASWEKCATIILRGQEDGGAVTLWKAVCEVDPSFPVDAPRDFNEKRIWEQIPTSQTILEAIRWAVTPESTPATNGAVAEEKAEEGESEGNPWDDIDLEPACKAELQKWFAMFQALHPAAPRGLLLFGPAGTGKTLLARTLAKASGADFIATTISDLKGPHIGGSAERVRQLWRRARNGERAIIFVDECEGIFGAREGVETDSFTRELLHEFLAQWEGVMDNSRKVWVIGATNRREHIDHAMVSRFGAELAFTLPNAQMRNNILRREMARCLVEYDDVPAIIDRTNGFSGRDLRTLAEAVARESFVEGADNICRPTVAHFDKHIEAIRKRGNIGVTKRSTWENLILPEATKDELKIMCEMLRRSEEMKAHDIELPRGLLLYGPAGVGKTEIARTLANESGLNFVGSKSTDFVGGYSGWSGQMTKGMFARARAESPAILFIDELDKIAPRPEEMSSQHGFTIEVIRALVEEMEGVVEHEGHVFVVAATNRLEAVDPTIVSRLGKIVEVSLPSAEHREALLVSRLKHAKVEFDLEPAAREIAALTTGYSGRDLVTLIASAQRRAVMRLLRNESPEVVLRLDDLRAELSA